MIKVSIKPKSQAEFIERLVGQGKALVRKRADILGESMVREVQDIIGSEFNVGDPAHRKPGPHLIESFTYEVDETSRGVAVNLTIKRGVDAKKVAALNYGAKQPYTIAPSGIIVGQGGRAMKRKAAQRIINKSGIGGRQGEWLSWPDPGGGRDIFARVVEREPFEGKHFMERAVERAVAKFRARFRART